MIIAIGGRMGSGKNTVCDIIQDLCKKNNGPQFEQKAFAGKLKLIGSILSGVPVEMFEDQEFKKTDLPNEWCYVKNGYAAKNMTVREFLQKLGTEAMREGLHANVWVNALFADYKYEIHRSEVPTRVAGFIDQHVYPSWCITDMRFPNEMEAVVEKGGITIRVVRPKIESLVDKMRPYSDLFHYGIPMPVEHPSETALDDANFDYEIINDSTIENLVEKVKEILTKSGII